MFGVVELSGEFGRVLGGRRRQLLDDFIDPLLERVLGDGERIAGGLGEHDGLVAPAQRHEFAQERDFQFVGRFERPAVVAAEPPAQAVDEVEVAVHFLVFDQGAAEDDLGNEDERDDVDGGFAVANQAGNKQPEHHAGHGAEQHPEEIIPEHVADFEHRVADEQVDGALGGGEDGERPGLAST